MTVLYLVIRYSALTYVVLDALEPAPILSDKVSFLASSVDLLC